MSTLTETQIEKLYGRKKPFIPTGYRLKIQNELGRAIQYERAGEIGKSQVRMVAKNIGKAKPAIITTVLEARPRPRPDAGVKPDLYSDFVKRFYRGEETLRALRLYTALERFR